MNDMISLYDAKERIRLEEIIQETGIHNILEKAGKKYFALCPKWNDIEHMSYIFWLNPQSQNLYNSGWFTIEDLRDWANNRGKIMK